MPYDPQRHHRRSLRLPGYDYTQPGAYFVTICVQDRLHLFGEVVDDRVAFNPYGRVAATLWERIPRHFPHVTLDAWVIMPNHMHGIIVITDDDAGRRRGEASPVRSNVLGDHANGVTSMSINNNAGDASPQHPTGVPSGSLGAIVGNYKSITTRRINKMRHTPGTRVWQRNYYEHIIRNADAWQRIAAYIHDNPARWDEDRLNS